MGLLLRRGGLYSSHLAIWRRQRKQGGIDAIPHAQEARSESGCQSTGKGDSRTAGRQCPLDQEAEECRADHRGSKRVAALLGNPIPNVQIDEGNSQALPCSWVTASGKRLPAAPSVWRGHPCIGACCQARHRGFAPRLSGRWMRRNAGWCSLIHFPCRRSMANVAGHEYWTFSSGILVFPISRSCLFHKPMISSRHDYNPIQCAPE